MSSRAATIAGYVVLVFVAVILEALSRRRDSAVPSLGSVLKRVMSSRSGRVAMMAGWAWLGLHFFAR